jgi:phosphoribosylformylglycinamidine synthase
MVDDVGKCATMDAKGAGNLLFIVGETKNELGGSHYYKINGQLGANVPRVDLKTAPKIAAKIADAISSGLAVSCHDCSEGGLAVALAETAFAGGLGIEADLRGLAKSADCTRIDAQLFSESNSRYIVEVEPGNYGAFAKMMLNLPFGQVGRVTEQKTLIIKAENGKTVINLGIDALKDAWQKPLKWQ